METEQERIGSYLAIAGELNELDSTVAASIIEQISKDRRLDVIIASRNTVSIESDSTATEKQKEFLRKLGKDDVANLSKQEASRLIDELTGRQSSTKKPIAQFKH